MDIREYRKASQRNEWAEMVRACKNQWENGCGVVQRKRDRNKNILLPTEESK